LLKDPAPDGDVEPFTEVGDFAFELFDDAADDEAGGVPAEATELAELPLVALLVLLRDGEEDWADERPEGVKACAWLVVEVQTVLVMTAVVVLQDCE